MKGEMLSICIIHGHTVSSQLYVTQGGFGKPKHTSYS